MGLEQECPTVTESPTRRGCPVINMQNPTSAETLAMTQANYEDVGSEVTCHTHETCPTGYTASNHVTSSRVSTSQTPSMTSSHISTNGHLTETVAAVHTIRVGGKTEFGSDV